MKTQPNSKFENGDFPLTVIEPTVFLQQFVRKF